jgi:MscS family membrane protein
LATADEVRISVLLRVRAVLLLLVATVVLCGSLLAPRTGLAQENRNQVWLLKGSDRSTPQAWITSFTSEAARLEALMREYEANRTSASLLRYSKQLEVLQRFFDLDAVPAAFRETVGNDAAVQMIDILNRLPTAQIQPAATMPGAEPWVTGPVWAIPGTEIVLVRRQDGSDAGNFVMPADVIAQLPNFHVQIMSLPSLRETEFDDMQSIQANLTGPLFPRQVAAALSRWLDAPLFGVPAWKLLVSIVAFLATVAGDVVVLRLIAAAAEHRSADSSAVLKILGPLTFGGSFVALSLFNQSQLILQGHALVAWLALRSLCVIIAAAWGIMSLANICAEFLIGSEVGRENEMNAHLTRMIGKTLGFFGALAVLIYGLGTLGVPAAGVITSLGIGGVGVAFATRVTMENLFGGFLLLIDRPFQIGDDIKTKDGDGRVTKIGVRYCHIETPDGDTLTIPNGSLSSSAITRVRRRVQ